MYGYDKVGNQIERPELTIAYTPFDLPSKYTRKADGAKTLLEYDGDQTRVRKTTPVDKTLDFGKGERVPPLAAPRSVVYRDAAGSNERIVAVVTQNNLHLVGVPEPRGRHYPTDTPRASALAPRASALAPRASALSPSSPPLSVPWRSPDRQEPSAASDPGALPR